MFYQLFHNVVAIHPLFLGIYCILEQWNLLPIHVHEAVTVNAFKACISVTVLTPIYHNVKLSTDVYSSTKALYFFF